MAQTIDVAKLVADAAKRGYNQGVAAKVQQVIGIFLGARQTMTKPTAEHPEPRPMLELLFLDVETGEEQSINCMPGARRTGDPELVPGLEYSVRWFGKEFQTVAGLGGFASTSNSSAPAL